MNKVGPVVFDNDRKKPVTDDVRRWKLMGMGALGVVGITAAALGVTFADVIKRVLTMGRF